MGFFLDFLKNGIDFVKDEVIPLRTDLVKAGLLKPDVKAFEPKANLTDPTNYGSMNYGYKEKWALIDYWKCRQIAYTDPIIAAIIQVRMNQVAAFCQPQIDKYKLGFKIKIRDLDDHPTPAEQKRIDEITEFILYTGVPENFEDTPERKRRDNFECFLRKIVRDTLTFDQVNFEITPRNNGMPYSFNAIDASTIRVVPDEKEKREFFGGQQAYDTKFLEALKAPQATGFREFKPKHPRYVQIINGMIFHTFDEWEMAFGVRNPRTDILSFGYGFSEIEMLVATITSHMNAEGYNRRVFTNGATVKGIMAFEGIVPPDQLEGFRRQWYAQSTGVSNAWKTPIIALGDKTKLNWVNLQPTNREMEFGKWMEYCIKSICGVYQIDPIEIGFDITRQGAGQSGGTGGLGQGDHIERVLYSQEKGLRPLLRFVQTLINDYIVSRIDPDFEFEFVGLNANSEKDELDLLEKKVKAFKTVNEIRAEHDLPPIKGLDEIKSPADMILDASWITAWSQAQAAAQQAEMQAQQPGVEMGGEGEGDQGEGEGEDQGDEDYSQWGTDELQDELGKLQKETAQGGEQDLKQPGAGQAKKSLEFENIE